MDFSRGTFHNLLLACRIVNSSVFPMEILTHDRLTIVVKRTQKKDIYTRDLYYPSFVPSAI